MKILQRIYIPPALRILNSRRDYPRPSTKVALSKFRNKKIKVIEIGTYKGYNALSILKNLNISKIYLIDPYEYYDEYKGITNLEGAWKIAHKDLCKWVNKIKWVKKSSKDALEDINEKVDFIYIDGNHAYEFVLKDLKDYWNKLKKGGIMAGHDINEPGVSRAVCEFIKEKDIYFVAKKQDWWIIK